MEKSVFITRKIPQEGIELLEKNVSTVDVFPHDRPILKEELLGIIDRYDGLLCLLTDPVDADVLEKSKNLSVVSNYAVGYNNIDVQKATELNICVTNTPGVLTDATADLAWALILGTARKTAQADTYARNKKFNGWSPTLFLGMPVANMTMGIIGAGRIGTAVALRSSGFSMKIIYFSNHTNKVLERKLNAEKVSLKTLLQRSDIISLHVPLTSQTRHMFGKNEFEAMKETAILINTSRGPVVNEKDLADALEKGSIAGAGLDVFENEPDIYDRLTGMGNTLLLPHIGSATYETRNKMARIAAENILAGLSGKKPEYLVNPQVFGI